MTGTARQHQSRALSPTAGFRLAHFAFLFSNFRDEVCCRGNWRQGRMLATSRGATRLYQPPLQMLGLRGYNQQSLQIEACSYSSLAYSLCVTCI
jgi:hypothetical protein